MSLANIGIAVCAGIIILLGIVVLIIKLTRKDDPDKDAPLIINFLSHKTGGRFIGVQRNMEIGKGRREIMRMLPWDLLVKDEKELEQIEDVTVIAEPNKVISLPKGRPSRDRNVKIILPKNADEVPNALKETELGKVLMLWTELKNINAVEVYAFKEGMKRQADHIKSMGAGEISQERIVKVSELFDDFLGAIIQATKKETKTSNVGSPSLRTGEGGGSYGG